MIKTLKDMIAENDVNEFVMSSKQLSEVVLLENKGSILSPSISKHEGVPYECDLPHLLYLSYVETI